jgi:hypothetical protein
MLRLPSPVGVGVNHCVDGECARELVAGVVDGERLWCVDRHPPGLAWTLDAIVQSVNRRSVR